MEFSFFITDNKSGYKTKESWLSKNHPELYEKILNYSSKFTLQLSFKERIWFYYNNLTERPKCVTCNSDVKFRERFDNPYGEFCSLLCINKNKEEMSKRQKNAFNLKYSVDYYPQHKDFINKQKKTKKEKYGSENYNNTEKSKITKFEKYGDKNYNNLEKQKKTILNKYGKENIVYSDFYKEKISNSFKEKYKGIKINTIDGMLVSINCDKCGEDSIITKQLLYERNRKKYEVCINCNPIGQNSRSGYEKELTDFLNSVNVRNIQSYRGLPNKQEIDVLIPDYNIGIEINGVYWHNELFKSENYHLNKHKVSEESGISLIQIYEDEWLYKKDIIKSIILNRLGKTENKIYGRKCEIREVEKNDSKKFLDDNHIQGNVNSKIKIGLYYNNELVSLMTFSKGRIIIGGKKNEWELTRFCNKINTNVIGASSKLFKYFLEKYEPKLVVSYSDIRWFNGGMYEKLGFNNIRTSKPNYWYVIDDIRYHRFNFRKSVLVKEGFDKTKTEKQIMFDRKIYRIFDCGNVRWEYLKI
jgi:hypothetical protein